MEKYVCFIVVFFFSLENLDDNFYFVVFIRFFVNFWYNFIEFVFYLNDEFDKINGFIIYGFVV